MLQFSGPWARRLATHLGGVPISTSLTVAWGRNWHAASASIWPTDSPLGPSGLLSWARIARMTASRVASSSLLNSLHVMVSALGGAGTTGTSVFLGNPGIGMFGMGIPGSPGTVDCGVLVVGVLIGGPGWVVIATVPGVVRSQPTVRPARINAAKATQTCVLIPATICGATS